MHGQVLLDKHTYELAKKFEPHNNAAALAPYKISGNLNMPKTQSLTLANYLNTELEEDEGCEVYDMLKTI